MTWRARLRYPFRRWRARRKRPRQRDFAWGSRSRRTIFIPEWVWKNPATTPTRIMQKEPWPQERRKPLSFFSQYASEDRLAYLLLSTRKDLRYVYFADDPEPPWPKGPWPKGPWRDHV